MLDSIMDSTVYKWNNYNLRRGYVDTAYREQFEIGKEYENYVATIIKKELKIQLDFYMTREEQLKGETEQGIEIKKDQRFRETGNLYIECFERSKPTLNWTEAGVLKNDNSWLYVIGDEHTIFFFSKKQLKMLYDFNMLPVIENTSGTSKGMLLSIKSGFFQNLLLKEIKIGEPK